MNIDYKKNKNFYPMLVTKEMGRDDKKDEFLLLWRQFDALPQTIKSIISSDKLVDFIYGISQHFNLNEMETEEFSRTIRRYFFGEIADGQFARIISELCKTSNEEGLEILKSIKNIRPEGEMRRNLVTGEMMPVQNPIIPQSISAKPVIRTQKPQTKFFSSQNQQVFTSPVKPIYNSNFSQMSIRRAMKLFPKLELQLFTETPIISQKYLKPIKPTIKNWLMIYEDFMGTGKKGSIERGNFLFQSDATKNLKTEEKQKLAFLLKSLDEEFPLTIDRSKGEVVFEMKSNENFSNESSNLENNNFSQTTDFSAPSDLKNEQAEEQMEESFAEENNEDNFSSQNSFSADFSSEHKENNFSQENASQSINSFNLNEDTNSSQNDFFNLKGDSNSVNSNQNSSQDFSLNSANSNLENKFISDSNFNAKVFTGLSEADFSQVRPQQEEIKPKFETNYSIDDLYQNKNSNEQKKLNSSLFPGQNSKFDENLSFSPTSQNSEISDESLSFTSNHVLPVEKSLLEKQRVE